MRDDTPKDIKPDIEDESIKPSWISRHVPKEIRKGLFVFKVKLESGGEVQLDMASDIEIEYERLEEQMDHAPGQYAFWAAVYSECKQLVTLMERKIKIRRGMLIESAIDGARAAGAKGLTDKQASSVVEKDELLNKWEVKFSVLQKNVGKLWFMIKAMEMKAELLRSRSGFKRHELESQR